MMKKSAFRSTSAVMFMLLVFIVNSSVTYSTSGYQSSSWASQQISACEKAGIIPNNFDSKPFTSDITRKDFCELLINTCRVFKIQLPELPASHPFRDTTDISSEYAFMLGLTQGTASGVFSPEAALTREMAAVMLSKMLMLFQSASGSDSKKTVVTTPAGTLSYSQPMSDEKATQILEQYSADYDLVSQWAKPYIADIYTLGIMSGTGGGRLDPKSKITREQAAVLSLNVLAYCDKSIIKAAGNVNEIITGSSEKNQFADVNEAVLNMTDISVKVWKLTASGSKETASLTLTINKNVAEDVKKIFEEIYNGKEKFPIKSCSAYSYRDGKSQHSNGTAIDINPEENYFISREGVIKAGTLWKPGVNPYSILPDGDVVRAFNRYGWHWSPDMNWRNGADYMHFSLSGK